MSNFTDSVKQNTPRLVVQYHPNPDGKGEGFEWGISSGIPMPALLGHITRAQLEMTNGSAEDHDCPQPAFVVAWNGEKFDWWVYRSIPVDSIVGMLEIIKATLIAGRVGQQAVSNRVQLLMPDGTPFEKEHFDG